MQKFTIKLNTQLGCWYTHYVEANSTTPLTELKLYLFTEESYDDFAEQMGWKKITNKTYFSYEESRLITLPDDTYDERYFMYCIMFKLKTTDVRYIDLNSIPSVNIHDYE